MPHWVGFFWYWYFSLLFNGLFALTYQSPTCKLFRFRNPWGKIMERNLKTFAHKGCKIAAPKTVFFFYRFFKLFTLFRRLFAPTSQRPMSKLFKFLESLEKCNKKRWSQIWKLLLINGVKFASYFFFLRILRILPN